LWICGSLVQLLVYQENLWSPQGGLDRSQPTTKAMGSSLSSLVN
jgi:hypothetical protein